MLSQRSGALEAALGEAGRGPMLCSSSVRFRHPRGEAGPGDPERLGGWEAGDPKFLEVAAHVTPAFGEAGRGASAHVTPAFGDAGRGISARDPPALGDAGRGTSAPPFGAENRRARGDAGALGEGALGEGALGEGALEELRDAM
mmetsp:Transcript_7653/g.17657  ORF Transcript_7653/g.17657 Transcript_7653/m.17657 type:complete len:144 (-) Transcript_7653:1020-1451(-)